MLAAGGLIGFLIDPLHVPYALLDVLDKRASVVSMGMGMLGLLVAGLALWFQVRTDSGSGAPAGSVSTGPRSPAISGGDSLGHLHHGPHPNQVGRPVRLASRPPHLAGRTEVLAELQHRLTAARTLPAVVAVHGLGGVGKTSLVLEYAHRHLADYDLVWQIPAEDLAIASAALAALTSLLDPHELADAADPVDKLHAVLAARTTPWLLIFDDVPDPAAVQALLPPAGHGHVLITSRASAWPAQQSLELPVLEPDQAMAFLLERTGYDDPETAAAIVTELGALPLALEQAGAYVTETGTSLVAYLKLLRTQRVSALAEGQAWGYRERVASTWHLSFTHLADTAPDASALLRLLACYAPDAIPYQLLLSQPAPRTSPLLPYGDLAVNAAVAALRRYSLISQPADGTTSLHRLVQAVTVDQLPPGERTRWHRTAADLLESAVPKDPKSVPDWPRFAQLVPHARAVLPPDSESLARTATYLGESGDYRTAALLYKEITSHRIAVLGADHPNTLTTRDDLARWTGEAGGASVARDALAALLPIRERVLGADHPNTLTTRHNLARWTGEAGDASAARDAFAALLPDMARVLGAHHPDTLTTRHNLAHWTGEAGDAAAARDALAVLLPIREQALGAHHPDTLTTRHNLARWTGEAGEAAAARDALTTLLPIREQMLGTDHPDTLSTRANLAHWNGAVGDTAVARDALAALLPDMARVLGTHHPQTLTTRATLAHWTEEAGDAVAARDVFAVLLSTEIRTLGTDHPDTLTTRAYLAHWMGWAGDTAGARDQLAALLPDMARVLGAHHPDTLTARHNLAQWTGAAGDATAARDAFAVLLSIEERILGTDHPDTLATRDNLARWTRRARRSWSHLIRSFRL
ncbi:FxSxx-COOH system tetratricopeptide repeat protein [Nonomuraea sediminis]|uniref:FxSxx-COOH system tetratricopeptide repeat protein n=1 Tax=Nonomuraea sediminis TaxID=2835864 RepID=UPI001BDBE728|nr:FxSxx-COOH system tetratricopeptide repeat protein [Nonomuraea sediminis]